MKFVRDMVISSPFFYISSYTRLISCLTIYTLRFLQQMTVEHRPWALKSCTDPSYLSSTVKFGLKRVEVVSQNGSSPREDKRQSSLGPTHPPPTHHPPFSFGK